MHFIKFKKALDFYGKNPKIKKSSDFINGLDKVNEEFYIENPNSVTIASYKFFLGSNYILNKKFSLAVDFLLEVVPVYIMNPHLSKRLGKVYTNLVACYIYLDDLAKAEKYAFLSTKILKDDTKDNYLGAAIINLCNVLMRQHKFIDTYHTLRKYQAYFDKISFINYKNIIYSQYFVISKYIEIDFKDNCEKEFFDYINNLEKTENYTALVKSYHSVELSFIELKNYQEAYNALKKKNKYQFRASNIDNKKIYQPKEIFLIDSKVEEDNKKIEYLKNLNLLKLKESFFLETLIELIPIPIFAVDNDMNYILCTEEYSKIIGKDKKEIIGSKLGLTDYIVTNEIKEICQKTTIGNIDKKTFLFDLGDNNIRIYDGYFTAFFNDKGDKSGAICVGFDNTDLYNAKKELENLNHTKDDFFSILGHDLRNSVGSMKELLQILYEHDTESENEKEEIIDELYLASKRTFYLLENLLSWSIAQKDGLEYQPQIFDIITLFNNCILNYDIIVKKKNITIVKNYPDSYKIFTDRNMLQTIVRNLINNAIKFTPAKGSIKLSLIDVKSQIKIVIDDSGIGMPENIIQNLGKVAINKSFYGTEGEKGTGLGLVLCLHLIEKLGGNINFKNKLGNGTVVTVSIPK